MKSEILMSPEELSISYRKSPAELRKIISRESGYSLENCNNTTQNKVWCWLTGQLNEAE